MDSQTTLYFRTVLSTLNEMGKVTKRELTVASVARCAQKFDKKTLEVIDFLR